MNLRPLGGLGSVDVGCCGCCGNTLPPGPERGGFFWYNARLSEQTLNGSDQSQQWNDIWPNAYHQLPQNAAGVLAGVSQWPVKTPNITPSGEPGMEYSWLGPGDFGCTLTQCLQTVTQLPDDAPYFVTAIVTPKGTRGGFVCTMRLTVPDLEMSLRQFNGPYQIVLSSQTNTQNYYTPLVDYTMQTIVCSWIFFGSAPVQQCLFRVNGVNISITPFLGLAPYTGLRGFSIGYCNAVFEGFDGFITDVRGYLGTDMATVLASEAWSMDFAGLP